MAHYLVIALVYPLVACFPAPVEGDKHPDVPLFPDTSNANLKVELMLELHGLRMTSQYYYGQRYSDYSTKAAQLVIYDHSFRLIANVADGRLLLTEDGATFSVDTDKHGFIEAVYLHQAPEFHSKLKLDLVDANGEYPEFDRARLALEYKEELAAKSKQADFDESRFISQRYYQARNKYRKRRLKDMLDQAEYICVLSEFITVVKSNGDFFAIKAYENLQGISEGLKAYSKKTSYRSVQTQVPESFDKTVLGNNSSGNHFVFGFSSYGYNYINLRLGGLLGQSKVPNNSGGPGLVILPSSDNQIILQKDSRLYRLTLSVDG